MFCRYCGKEVANDAYMCPSCGRMLKPLPQGVIQPVQAAPAEPMPVEVAPVKTAPKNSRLPKISRVLNKLGAIFNGVGLGFFVLQIIGWILIHFVVRSNVTYYETPEGIVYNNYEALIVFSTMLITYGWLFSLIFIAVAAECATGGFVLGLIQKEDMALRKRAIIIFTVCMVTTAVVVGFGSFGWIYMIYFMSL